MRASGGRGCHPCGTAGSNPNKLQGTGDGLATRHGGGRGAQCPMGTGEGGGVAGRRRESVRFGVWNVWGLKDKKPMLVREANRYGLELVGLSETKYKGTGLRALDDGWQLFYSGVGPEAHASAGVGILTSPRMAELVIEWTPRSERVGVLRLQMKSEIIAFVVVYAPNAEAKYEGFLEELGLALDSVPASDSLVLLGDFNAHVGVDDTRWKGVIGRNGDASFNANGRHLLDFCSANGLSIMNTYFRHRGIHKYTW